MPLPLPVVPVLPAPVLVPDPAPLPIDMCDSMYGLDAVPLPPMHPTIVVLWPVPVPRVDCDVPDV